MDIANQMRDTAEELSEEDQQLKNELDMLVERLGVRSFQKRCPVLQNEDHY